MKLTLDEVKDLGGNESDMELLKGIDSDDDEGDEETVVGLTDSETPEASLVDELKRLIHSPDKVSPTPEQKAANKTVQQNIAKLVKKKFPKKLLFNPAETWYDIQLPLLQEKVSDDIKEQYTEKLFDLAHSLYEAQADIYRGTTRLLTFFSQHQSLLDRILNLYPRFCILEQSPTRFYRFFNAKI